MGNKLAKAKVQYVLSCSECEEPMESKEVSRRGKGVLVCPTCDEKNAVPTKILIVWGKEEAKPADKPKNEDRVEDDDDAEADGDDEKE